jgi:ferredoxin-type protein NapH
MIGIRPHRFLLARRTTQLGILLLFWLGAHLHLGLLTGNLSSAHLFRSLPLADPFAVLQILATGHWVASTVLLGAATVLLFYLLVGGRAFCSWVCPVNPVTDLAGWMRWRLQIAGQLRVDRSVRFWILGLALLVSAISGVAAFEQVSPIAMLHRELIYGPGLGLLAALAILLLDLYVVRRGWCSSLCPLGAFYSLVGRYSPTRIGFDAGLCDRCGECLPVCPEPQLIHFGDMAAAGFVDSGDCTNCARCLEVCPRDAYHFRLRFKRNSGGTRKDGGHHATRNAA